MKFWVQLCVLSVIFNCQVVLNVTELGESWVNLEIAREFGEILARFLDALN